MKYLDNEIIVVSGQEVGVSDLIKVVIETPKAGGINLVEMRKALKVIDLAEQSKQGERMEFEDADAAYLKEQVKGFKWAAPDAGVLDFCDRVVNMSSKVS